MCSGSRRVFLPIKYVMGLPYCYCEGLATKYLQPIHSDSLCLIFSCRDILDKDKSDLEIVSFALGALLNVMSEEIEDDEVNIPADIGKLTWKSWLLLNEKIIRSVLIAG